MKREFKTFSKYLLAIKKASDSNGKIVDERLKLKKIISEAAIIRLIGQYYDGHCDSCYEDEAEGYGEMIYLDLGRGDILMPGVGLRMRMMNGVNRMAM